MFGKFVVLAVAVILAAPICAAVSGSSSGGTSSGGGSSSGGGAGAGSHGGGGGGGGGEHGGANSGVGRSSGFSGRAAAATARSVVNGHELSSRAGIAHTDAMHATHLATDKRSEAEHMNPKSPGTDHHRPYRREPNYDYPVYLDNLRPCTFPDDMNTRTWFACNGPAKSIAGHKS